MTLQLENFTGVQALDVQQFIDAQNGHGWLTGLEPSLNVDAAAIQVDVTAGDVVVHDVQSSVAAQSIALPNGDPDWPRRDVVYIDENLAIQFIEGVPREPVPEGTEGVRSETPELPDMADTVGVPIVGVWVPPNATGPADISETAHFQDRRLRPWPTSLDELFNLDPADYDPGATVAETDQNETITAEWTFDALVTFLQGTSGISHDNLDGVSASDHHTKTQPADITSANWGDYEIQVDGTDGAGIINFKTQ